MTPTKVLYEAAGYQYPEGDCTCWLCGGLFDQAQGQPTSAFVKPTFTDRDKAARPASDTVCPACVFSFDERCVQLAQLVGKAEPQRTRNYSHIVTADGIWLPLTKAVEHRRIIKQLISGDGVGIFPPLVVIAESGQKHLIFRAMTNPVGAYAGWVQFEEQRLWVEPRQLAEMLTDIEWLYNHPAAKYSKREIETGDYDIRNILATGIETFETVEERLKEWRGSLLWKLACFLATKEDGIGYDETDAQGSAISVVAGRAVGVQGEVRPQYLGAVSGANPQRGVHIDSQPVLQPGLFDALS